MLREPLVHFILAGLVIFWIGHIHEDHADLHRIVITPQRTARLASQYALQFGTRPDGRVLTELLNEDVHDEILFREGLALGLDKDDEIVRRRIIQKMQFLLEDVRAPADPDNAQLEAYYREHLERYILPARATFSHIYFSATRERAVTVLRQLPAGSVRAPQSGDPFPDLYDFSNYAPEQVERVFGRSEFSRAVFSTPCGHWVGPLRSAYGWHLLYVQSRQSGKARQLAEIRDQVRADYLLAQQHQANEAAFRQLERQFIVRVARDVKP